MAANPSPFAQDPAAAGAAAALHARVTVSSPVCYADEPDAAPAEQEEMLAALNELLEAERAGARVTLESLGQTDVPELKRLLADIHHDEVRWCGVLIGAIRSAGATPSARTGAFYDKAMAVPDLAARLALLNRGQGWVARKLRDVLPRIGDARVRLALDEMLASHERNVERVQAQLGAARAPGAS